MQTLIDAKDADSRIESMVGGKAASLSALIAAGFNVPDFCVVPCRMFPQADPAVAVEALRAPLKQWLGRHPSTTRYAVRSSARGEDSADNSFAGLYATILDVTGIEGVLNAILKCWRSYDNREAVDYRTRRGGEAGAMGVIVQVMIPAEWAGVSFSANPVSLALSEGVINATRGLGEALVSGSVNPEEIVLCAPSGKILKRHTPLNQPPMPERLLSAVWQQTLRAAEAFRFPQDVEWAIVGSTLYILQSRPITTIADVFYSRYIEPWNGNDRAAPDDPQRVWTRAYADEIWAPPVSPLFYNIQNLTPSFTSYWKWHDDRAPLPPDVFKYYRAAAYADVEVIRKQYAYHPAFSRISGILNFFPRNMQQSVRHEAWLWRGRLKRTVRFEGQQRKLRSLAHNHRTLNALWPDFIAESDRWFALDLGSMSLEQIAAHRADLNKVVAVVSPACGFAVAYHAHDLTFILTGLLEQWFGEGDALYARVTSGLEGSITVDESEHVWALGQQLRNCDPALLRAAHRGDYESFEKLASNTPAGRAVLERFQSFWVSHRHRGASYKDLIFARWGDDRGTLLRLVASFTGSDAKSPRAANAEMAALRRKTQRELLDACRGLKAWRRPILRWLFRYNEIYMSERDNHRFYFDRVWYQLRRIYLAYGAKLVDAGVLSVPDDVFYLGTAEVEQALQGALDASEARARVAVRRRVWSETLKSQPPKFLVGYSPHDEGVATMGGHAHIGIGASPGIATGRARVVYEVSELHRIADGEILVTRQTDPAWSTIFGRIGGLVLETGGVLAHGASLCREFNLPCVTALERASVLFQDGDLLQVDGTTGRVTRIEAASTATTRAESPSPAMSNRSAP